MGYAIGASIGCLLVFVLLLSFDVQNGTLGVSSSSITAYRISRSTGGTISTSLSDSSITFCGELRTLSVSSMRLNFGPVSRSRASSRGRHVHHDVRVFSSLGSVVRGLYLERGLLMLSGDGSCRSSGSPCCTRSDDRCCVFTLEHVLVWFLFVCSTHLLYNLRYSSLS